jgi:hypothetical protein
LPNPALFDQQTTSNYMEKALSPDLADFKLQAKMFQDLNKMTDSKNSETFVLNCIFVQCFILIKSSFERRSVRVLSNINALQNIVP